MGNGAVAQLVERFVRIEEVVVSITISSTRGLREGFPEASFHAGTRVFHALTGLFPPLRHTDGSIGNHRFNPYLPCLLTCRVKWGPCSHAATDMQAQRGQSMPVQLRFP